MGGDLGIEARVLPPLTVITAAPRGFCAGVERAIAIVEQALALYGPPIYVRHEIVHNARVVGDLRSRGAIFVRSLEEIPRGSVAIFSAHGVARSVEVRARQRDLRVLDATCPLVSKVHLEARHHYDRGCHILLIGHRDHPEVVGTMGQLPAGAISLIETAAQAEAFDLTGLSSPLAADSCSLAADSCPLAYVTQTTLSVDDTRSIVGILKRRFPGISGPHGEDICYATTNRQHAVKALARVCEAILVVGAENSSNSNRLVEVARLAGCSWAQRIARHEDVPWGSLTGIRHLGLTAGASAPEVLVQEVLAALSERFRLDVETLSVAEERISFNLPRVLRDPVVSD